MFDRILADRIDCNQIFYTFATTFAGILPYRPIRKLTAPEKQGARSPSVETSVGCEETDNKLE